MLCDFYDGINSKYQPGRLADIDNIYGYEGQREFMWERVVSYHPYLKLMTENKEYGEFQ